MDYLELVCNVTRLAMLSPAAEAIFAHFTNRKRRRKAETVRRLMQICGKGTKRSTVVWILREMEFCGFGRVILGRRRRESRFEWAEV